MSRARVLPVDDEREFATTFTDRLRLRIDRELARRPGDDLPFEGGGAATIRLATAR